MDNELSWVNIEQQSLYDLTLGHPLPFKQQIITEMDMSQSDSHQWHYIAGCDITLQAFSNIFLFRDQI